MRSQEVFLNSLLDFSNIPSKRTTNYNPFDMPSVSEQNKSITQQQKKASTDRLPEQMARQSQQEMISTGNDKLLKAFNTLREKLSLVSRQNISLKQSLTESQQQLNEHNRKQSHYMNQVHQLTKKLTSTEQQLSQYKMRLTGVKQSMQQSQTRAQQLQKNRINTQRLYEQNKRLKEQLRLSMQISVQQKLHLEQQIQSLKLKEIQQSRSNQQAQNQLYNKTTQYIRLQNQYKKLKLIYEQEVFTKKLNSQSTLLVKENQQLKLVVEQLQAKLKKEKNKKYQLETKLLQLEEKVRLFGTRTDVYQGELQTIVKKIKKVQKDHISAKKQANQALNQKLSWQERFYHSSVILQELISRVKRQLKGDAVDLARTCQFRLNKLKNGQRLQITQKPHTTTHNKKSRSSTKKLRSQSQKRQNQLQNWNHQQNMLNDQLNKLVTFSNSKEFRQSSLKQQELQRTVLKQKPQQNTILTNTNINTNLSDVKKKLFSNYDLTTASKHNPNELSTKDRQTFPLNNMSINTTNPTNELNLQAKIRKQRQMMEKKLREKILYHKIEDATSSPVKNKLREDYFNINGLDLS